MLQLLESGGVQAKLRVSQPGDADEQDADRAAEQVVFSQAAPRLQRKCACGGSCAQCQEQQEPVIHRRERTAPVLRSFPYSIQRQAATSTTEERSHRAAGADADTRRDQAKHPGTHPRTLIVEDDAPSLGPGQMRKTEFVALLQATTCATADAVLESVGHTTKGCPYIKKWLAHYKGQAAAHLMRAMHKYAPETVRARSAYEAIALVNQRVERAALTWAKTGKMTDLPEGIAEEMAGGGGFLGAVMGFAHSGFGSALLGFIGGGKKKEEKEGTSSGARGAGGVQRKSRGGAPAGGQDAAAVQEQLGSGQSLDGGVQRRMSSAFGYDFSGVRVHTDATAGELSGQVNARAFTIGRDVAFAQGEYQPGTLIGDALIAHELAHVVQQGGGSPSGGAQTKDASLGDDSSLEQDADRSAVGAVVSALTGAKKGLADVSANALPRLKSGLKLQKCNCNKSAPTPTQVSTSDLATLRTTQRTEALASATASGLADEGAMAQTQADFMSHRNLVLAQARFGPHPTPEQIASMQREQVASTSIAASVNTLSPAEVAAWTARANTSVATVVSYAAVHHPELRLEAADFHVDVAGVESRGAGVIAYGSMVGGRQVAVVGRTFVRYVDANPAYAMSVVVHELHGHPEYGTYGSPGVEYGLELYDKAAALMPGYVQPTGADRRSELDAFAYQETEIYSLLRSLPYHTSLAAADAALQPAYIDPEPTVRARIRLIKSQWEPRVAKALLRGLYRRLAMDSRLTPAAIDAFRRGIRANFSGAESSIADDILQ